ncbi:MAG: diguanylate cyclase [Thiotrichales bacterium]|nr:diguanylate cyclase [Thiotrichales bacterium]
MHSSPVILAVDDTPQNLDIIVELLSEFDVRDVVDGRSALEMVNKQPIDLILLDIMMPEMDGYEVCKILKANPKTKHIPVIFITANTDDLAIQKAYDVGASDYISKPVKPQELLARVNTQLKLQALIASLEDMAFHDSLTGILNRRKFFELGSNLFNDTDQIAAVMIDIDKFKRINDSFGHAVGDEVIRRFAHVVSETLPPGVLFGRLGGEEFALLCEHFSEEGVSVWIDSLRKQIESLDLIKNGHKIDFTISNGIAIKETQMENLDDLLNLADEALYEAKNSGRNKTVLISERTRKVT